MYKIEPQTNKKFTVRRYFRSTLNKNIEAWSITNLNKSEVMGLLGEGYDTEFAIAIIQDTHGPAILVADGDVITTPTKPKPFMRIH